MEPSPAALLCVKFQSVDAIMLIALAVLIMCSAFFSSSETAFSTANSIRMKNYANDKVKGARKALYIMENYDRTLATILVGNNFVNIASTTIAAFLFGKFIFLEPILKVSLFVKLYFEFDLNGGFALAAVFLLISNDDSSI